MSLTKILTEKFGDPADKKTFDANNMELWQCGEEFTTLPFPRMYVNKYIIQPLRETFTVLCNDGLIGELETFNGCWQVRSIRGYPNAMSTHSWALAVDFNANDNPLGWDRETCIENGLKPFTDKFLQVWRDTDWIVGYDFKRVDGMHFERTKEFRKLYIK